MNNYTKGKWRVTNTVLGGHGVIIGKHSVDIPTDNHLADAQLIAKSPRMYEALKDCLNWLNEAHPDELYMRNILSKALTKAEGK